MQNYTKVRTIRARALHAGALIIGTSGLWTPSLPAAAADAATTGAGDKLAEIVVTAQRREQNMQDVGTSVTAFDAKTLEQFGFKDVTDVAGQVPGLQYNQYGATVTIYNLRGVSQNDFSDHQEAPIAVYADDAYIGSTGALAGSLFDLERVEVLRGPQGTLFGRNATGGLIQYVSKLPTDSPEAYVQLTGGNYGTFESEGALSGPLSDRVSARLSFDTSSHDGYITNRIGHSIEDQNQYAMRLQFRIKPTDDGEILIKLHALTNSHETAGDYSWAASAPDATGRGVFAPAGTPDLGGYVNTGGSPFSQAEDRRGLFNRTVWGANVRVNWKFDSFSLASVTDYLKMQKRYGEDSDMSPNPLFNYDTQAHYQQFSQEFRINGKHEGLRWIAGVYYLNYKTTNFEDTSLPDYIPPVPFPYGNGDANLNLRTSSPSAFGQLEYSFTDHWVGIVGARYTIDQKQYLYNYRCNVCGPPDANSPPGGFPFSTTYSTGAGYPDAEKTYRMPMGKVELDYKVDQDNLLYASVNRGDKGGGWSAPSSGYVNLNPAYGFVPQLKMNYDEERLTSYEAGFKSTFWDGAARLNGDVFYYDYKNYQGFFLDVATQIVENIDAKVKGSELELAVVPFHGFHAQLGVSYLDSRALNVPTPSGILVTSQLPQAPPWSVNAVARYEWPAFGGKLSAEVDAKWNKQMYLELINAPVDLQSSYTLTNARIGYTDPSGRWDVAAYCKNCFNTLYRIYNLDLSGFLGVNQAVYGPPRLYGVNVAYHWGK
ncbi:MAG TPA: TonB-dependent receptor [Steroidobacteraceae bacterium]|nr:TonB-dependent receptor [Steroidobacteraceae bacterium]